MSIAAAELADHHAIFQKRIGKYACLMELYIADSALSGITSLLILRTWRAGRTGAYRMKYPVFAPSIALLLTGCASHRIYSPNYDPRGISGNPVVISDVSILGRKAIEDSHVDEVKEVCGKADLVSVEVRKSVLEGLASVLTLGIVSPARIVFYCGKEPISGQ